MKFGWRDYRQPISWSTTNWINWKKLRRLNEALWVYFIVVTIHLVFSYYFVSKRVAPFNLIEIRKEPGKLYIFHLQFVGVNLKYSQINTCRDAIATMDFGAWSNMLALCVVNGCFAVVGIFLNSLVILCFWKSAQLRKKLCYFMIFVLACSDLIVVTIIHPLLLSCTIFWFTKHGVIIRFIFDPFFGFSMFTLLTMNLERYWAVRHPYFHQRSITKRRLLGLLLVFWGFVLIVSILSHRKVFRGDMLGLTILGVIFLLILYINYQMFVTVRAIRQNDALVLRHSSDRGQNASSRTGNSESRGVPDLKNASTCFWAILCFFVCSFPVLVHNGIRYAQKETFNDDVRMPFLLWAQTFLSLNSTFNCVIFFYRTKALRCEGKKLLRRCGFFVEDVSATSV